MLKFWHALKRCTLCFLLFSMALSAPVFAQRPPSVERQKVVEKAAKQVSRESGVSERALKTRTKTPDNASEAEILKLMRAEAKAELEDRELLRQIAADLTEVKEKQLAQDAGRALDEGRTEDFVKAYIALQAEIEKAAIERSDDQTWANVVAANENPSAVIPVAARIEIIVSYLSIFPTGKHIDEARTMLFALEAQQKAEEEALNLQEQEAAARVLAEKQAAEQAKRDEEERVRKATPWLRGFDSKSYDIAPSGLYAVSFLPNSRNLAAGTGDGDILIINGTNGKLVNTLKGHSRAVRSLAFSNDGKKLLSISNDGNARVWDWSKATELLIIEGGNFAVNSAVFYDDGKSVIVASSDGSVRMVVINEQKWSHNIVEPSKFYVAGTPAIALSKDEKTFLVGQRGTWMFLDPKRSYTDPFDTNRYLSISEYRSNRATFSADGQYIFLGTNWLYSRGQRHIVCNVPPESNGGPSKVAFSPDNRFLSVLTSSFGSKVVPSIMELGCGTDIESKRSSSTALIPSSRLLATLDGHDVSVQDMAFAADGAHFATVSADGKMVIWSDRF